MRSCYMDPSCATMAMPVTGGWKECERYNTSFETVETCTAKLTGETVSAGQELGTGGLSKALGLMGLEFGETDSRVDNGFVANWRPFNARAAGHLFVGSI